MRGSWARSFLTIPPSLRLLVGNDVVGPHSLHSRRRWFLEEYTVLIKNKLN